METPTKFKDVIKQMYANGWEALPIKPNDKNPGVDGWNSIKLDKEIYKKWLANGKSEWGVGIRLGGVVAVDIDIMDAAFSETVLADAEFSLGSGGIVRVGEAPKTAYIIRCDQKIKKRKVVVIDAGGAEHKIEILAKGQQVVMYGMHPTTKSPYFYPHGLGPAEVEVSNLPSVSADEIDAWLGGVGDMLPEGWILKSSYSSRDEEDWLINYKAPPKESEENVKKALSVLDSGMDHDSWLQVGMAIHHWCQGSVSGFEIWDTWSRKSEKYPGTSTCRKRWDSFHNQAKGHNPVTLASVFKMVKDTKDRESLKNEDVWLEIISKETDITKLRCDIKKRIKTSEMSAIVRETVIKRWVDRIAELGGPKILMPAARKELTPIKRKPKLPSWAKYYVYVQKQDMFFHTILKDGMSTKAFDLTYSNELAFMRNDVADDSESAMYPTKYVTSICGMQAVSRTAYMPTDPILFSMNGISYANLYDPNSVPRIPEYYSYEEEKAIFDVKKHFEWLFETEQEQQMMLSWIVFNVRNPGKKIRWAPLIWGLEGDGKSFFGNLLGAVMGERNIRSCNSRVLEAGFTAWAHGYAVCVFEEIMTPGHNRHEITNGLKTYITNDYIDVHPKGVDPYNVPNTTNYLLLTNHEDALPLTEGSRRYYVLKTRYADDVEGFKNAVDKSPSHYTRIFDAIQNHPGALRKWLLGLDYHADFNPNGHAIDTEQKQRMIELNEPEETKIIKDILENGGVEGVSENVISIKHLSRILQGVNCGTRTKQLSKALKSVGFTREFRGGKDNRVVFGKERVRIWVKKGAVPDKGVKEWAEKELKNTLFLKSGWEY